MIKQFRKASEHLYTRIFIGLIVFAFILWGITDFKNNYVNDNYLVEFKYLPNITLEEFLTKKRENLLQSSQSNKDSPEEENKLTYLTLNQLINERLINKVIKDQMLDIDNITFIENIKKTKAFQDEDGLFDKARFEKFLSSTNISQEEFMNSYKQMLLQNLIFNIYESSIYIPKILQKHILNYSIEKRIFDLVSVEKLNSKGLQLPIYTEKDLKEFFDQNQNLFKLEESRQLNYVRISYNDLATKYTPNHDEIARYYEENKNDFEGKTLEQSKNQIINLCQNIEKSNQIYILIKNLEDEIAAGNTLDQISKKHKLKINFIENFTNSYIPEESFLKDFKDTIIGMQEREVSYPIEIDNGLIIFEIEKINPAKIPEFKDVLKKIDVIFRKHKYEELNFAKMKEFATIANSNNFIKEASQRGFNIDSNISITRNGSKDRKELPSNLFNEIFKHSPQQITDIIQDKDYYYIAIIRNILKNPIDSKSEELIKNNIQKDIKQSIIDDMLLDTQFINQIKVNSKLLQQQDKND
jgi:peptidyl-prolyl cis-trans isomerase D